MTKIRTLLRWDRSRRGSVFLVDTANTGEPILLRVPPERLPDDIDFATIEINIDVSGAVARYITFLREAVRREPDSRLSGNNIWGAWAECNGVSPSLQTINGIDRKDIHDYFRFAFNEDEMSWKRLDGKPQWVWMGYELVSKGDDSAPGDESSEGVV